MKRKTKRISDVGEKRGSLRGTVGKGGYNRTLFRVFMLPWWQHTKEMVWELGQTCEADGNGPIKILMRYFRTTWHPLQQQKQKRNNIHNTIRCKYHPFTITWRTDLFYYFLFFFLLMRLANRTSI